MSLSIRPSSYPSQSQEKPPLSIFKRKPIGNNFSRLTFKPERMFLICDCLITNFQWDVEYNSFCGSFVVLVCVYFSDFPFRELYKSRNESRVLKSKNQRKGNTTGNKDTKIGKLNIREVEKLDFVKYEAFQDSPPHRGKRNMFHVHR